jgi:hypothetical protein
MDMQALIEEMSALIVKIKSGVATQGELEAFAAAASELNERAIILRYKSYEAKVFGTPVKPVAEPASEPTVESLAADAIPESEIVTNESTNNESESESVSDIETENSELSFDLFSMDNEEEIDSSETEIPTQEGIGAEEEMEAPIMHDEVPEVESADDESLMEYPEEGIEAAIEHIENTTPEAEPAVDARFIAQSDESMFDNVTNVPSDESASNHEVTVAHSEEFVSDNPISETDTAFADEVPAQEAIVSTTVEVAAGDVHPVYKRLSNEDNSLAARLMAVRLETLKGAFGFNERLQIIQELFDGSNDDFTQAIERLDTLNSKNEARNIVSTIAHQYAWDKDSNLALEFIQKVERRYA